MRDLRELIKSRKLLGAVLVVVVLSSLLKGFVSGISSHASNTVSPNNLSFFHTEGRDIVADWTGEKIVFRGVNVNGLEFGSFFDNPYPGVAGTNYFRPRSQDLDDIQAMGFNVIRVPFEWARLVPGWQSTDPLPTALDSTYLGILDEVVQMAAARHIYVILDMHDFLKYWSGQSSQECVDSSSDHQQLLAQTWKLLADHYSDNPGVLGYDLINEPVRQTPGEPCGSCEWQTIAQLVVDAIRSVDSNHLIFIEGPNFSLASDWPVENGKEAFITDTVNPSRIVYSPHVYFDFDNDSRYGNDDTPTLPAEGTGPIGQWKHYVRDRLLPTILWSIDNDVPILIGETGVPCTPDWAALLDHVYRNFFEPFRLSVTVWNYIDPAHDSGSLNLLACQERYQLDVLELYLGGVYEETGNITPTPSESLIYDEIRVNPWDIGLGYWGDVDIDFRASTQVFEGNRSIRARFADNFDGVKFAHRDGLDTRLYAKLRFWIYLTGSGQQDFKIFTTSPRSDCDPGPHPEYPSYPNRPQLTDYLPPDPPVGEWLRAEIPLEEMVDPNEPIISGIAFQNMGAGQDEFYLDLITLEPIIACGVDFDDNGRVDVRDLQDIALYLDSRHGDGRYSPYNDINGDKAVDGLDVTLGADHWREICVWPSQ